MAARMQPRPPCESCNGERTVLDMFSDLRLPCDACDGTGYDLWSTHTEAVYVDASDLDAVDVAPVPSRALNTRAASW